jgi:hypothetical protein
VFRVAETATRNARSNSKKLKIAAKSKKDHAAPSR